MINGVYSVLMTSRIKKVHSEDFNKLYEKYDSENKYKKN